MDLISRALVQSIIRKQIGERKGKRNDGSCMKQWQNE